MVKNGQHKHCLSLFPIRPWLC